jgi:hypothetical protein
MKYDKQELFKLLQEASKMLYAAQDISLKEYEDAIGETSAWLEGHNMHLQEAKQAAHVPDPNDPFHNDQPKH